MEDDVSAITFYDEGIRKDSTDERQTTTAVATTRAIDTEQRVHPVRHWAAFEDEPHEEAQRHAFRFLQHVFVRYNAYLFLCRAAKTCKRGGDIPLPKQEEIEALETYSAREARAAEEMRQAIKQAKADVAAAAEAKEQAEAKAKKVLNDQKKKIEKLRNEANEARIEASRIASSNSELREKLKTLQELEAQFSEDDLEKLREMLAQQAAEHDGEEYKSKEAIKLEQAMVSIDALKGQVRKLQRELKEKNARAARMSAEQNSRLNSNDSVGSGSRTVRSSKSEESIPKETLRELEKLKIETSELRSQLRAAQARLETANADAVNVATAAAAAAAAPVKAPEAELLNTAVVSSSATSSSSSSSLSRVDPQQFAAITKKLGEIKGLKESIVAMEQKFRTSIDKLTERFDGPFQEHYKPGFTGVMGENPEMKAAINDLRKTLTDKERKLETAERQAAEKERECADLEKQLKEYEFGMVTGGSNSGIGAVSNRAGATSPGLGGGYTTQIVYKTKDIEMPTSASELFDLIKLARDNWSKFSRLIDEFARKIETVKSTEAAAKTDQVNGEDNSAGFANLVEESESSYHGLIAKKQRVEQQLTTFNANLPGIARGALEEIGSTSILAASELTTKDSFRLCMEVVHAVKAAPGNLVPPKCGALVTALSTSLTSLVKSMDLTEELPKAEALISSIDRDLNTMTCAL